MNMHTTSHRELQEELIDTKALVLGISKYIEKKRNQQRYFDIFITLLASGGSLFFFKEKYVTFLSILLIALASIAKVILDSEQNLVKLDRLWCRQNSYCNDLQNIYSKVYNGHLSEIEYHDEFYRLKKEYSSDLAEINELTHGDSGEFAKIYREEADYYYKRKFPITK